MTGSFKKLRRSSWIGFYVLIAYRRCVGRGSPLRLLFWGGPRSGTNHFRLEFGFIRFSPFRPLFVGSSQVQFALFCVRRWKDGLSSCPVETVWLFLQTRGRLRLVQNTFSFCWMRLCVFWTLRPSFAAFLRCLLSWHPGDFRFHLFGRRFCRSDPWHSFFGAFPQMDERFSW
jgi:hypothetical protein